MFRCADRHANEIIYIWCEDSTCCREFCSIGLKKFFKKVIWSCLMQRMVGMLIILPFMNNVWIQNKIFVILINLQFWKKPCENDFWPSFYLSSITEKKRYMSLFHRQNKVKVHSDLDIICNYQDCNKRFGSQPSLSRHKKIESHTKRQT